MPDRISEADEMTFRVLAIVNATTVAQERRAALADYARRARRDPDVAEIVRLIWKSRRERHGATVIRIGGRSR